MVRRWSYVNLVNRTNAAQYKIFECFSNDSIFKESTVFRKKRSLNSLVRRKAWKRRRHWNQWINYYNVLFNWSQSYTSHSKYLRVLMMTSLLKYNFISYNGVGFLTESSGFYPGLEYLNYVILTRKTNHFMIRKARHFYQLNTFLRNSQTVFITTISSSNLQFKENPLTPTIVYPITSNQVAISESKSLDLKKTLSMIFSAQTNYVIGYYVAFYKTVVYLILSTFYKKIN